MVKRKLKNKFIFLDKNFTLYFDKYNWYFNDNYVFTLKKINNKWKKVYLHRLITNCPTNKVVDHINGNTLDNRLCNLRICSIRENVINRKVSKSKKKTKYLGIFWNSKRKNWEVKISVNRKLKYLGSFKYEKVAAKVYNKFAKKYFKQFARLNVL